MAAPDLGRVAEIERETFGDPWSRRAFADLLGQPHIRTLAADDAQGRLVGYAIASTGADEGEILNIAVERGSRGQGIGRLLLGTIIRGIGDDGVEHVYLEVRRSNQAAIALYRGAGFRPLGVRPGYYAQPREDALTMTLELGSQSARKG